ncbi:MAG: NADH:ubiquinone oxidoreductase subunit J [Hirschia sp.]|nr:NADH:ubiquinone oxidoreductase subunit J [Hirschia sp.]MBF18049.1 NADH:ubiquinone oxidoreductase subunit J [Hirschia sp.]
MQLIAFYILSTVVLLSAVFVISARNPVHSVLWLILSFFTAAGLLVLIGAEFLAMLLVVVYVGAVAVLFLFVVMMLDVDFVELKQGFLNYSVIGGIIAVLMCAEIIFVASAVGAGDISNFDPSPGADTNAAALSNVLYTDNLLLFQMAGVVLLIAMIGAIVLTLRHRTHIKRQKVEDQTARHRGDAVSMVNVQPGQGIDTSDSERGATS